MLAQFLKDKAEEIKAKKIGNMRQYVQEITQVLAPDERAGAER